MKKNYLPVIISLFVFAKAFTQLPCCEVLHLRADKGVITDSTYKVRLWKDVSGNGNNVKQTNPISQPLLQENIFGNKPAILFDGVNGKYFLSNTTSNLMSAGSPRTVFVVGKMDSAAVANGGGSFPSAGGTLFTFRRSTPVFALQAARVSSSDYVYTAGLGTNSNAATISHTFFNKSKSNCLFIDAYISSGSNTFLELRQNGKPIALSQAGSIVIDDGANGFTVGDREDFSGQDWQGYIAEIIVYDRKLDSLEIKQIEKFLARKYSCNSLDHTTQLKQGFINPLIIKISPNPARNNLLIEGLPESRKMQLCILDFMGNIRTATAITGSNYNCDISQLKQGAYILKIQTERGVFTKRFIKE